MTDQERSQILKMIENGKISPEEGLRLMQTLEQSPAEDEIQAAEAAAGKGSGDAAQSDFDADSRFARVKATARRLWQIPLWIGIGITVLCALGMYGIMRGPGMNFWFYFLMLPLLVGVAVIALAVGTRQARWIFVDVRQKNGQRPEHIFLGFPLPLRLTAWFLRTFGNMIPNLKKTNVDEVIQIIEMGLPGDSPMIVNVDEGDEGERVQVR